MTPCLSSCRHSVNICQINWIYTFKLIALNYTIIPNAYPPLTFNDLKIIWMLGQFGHWANYWPFQQPSHSLQEGFKKCLRDAPSSIRWPHLEHRSLSSHIVITCKLSWLTSLSFPLVSAFSLRARMISPWLHSSPLQKDPGTCSLLHECSLNEWKNEWMTAEWKIACRINESG